MARSHERGTVALQGYDPTEDLDPAMGPQPQGESRIEMSSEEFVSMLADHLTDEELSTVQSLRVERHGQQVRAAV